MQFAIRQHASLKREACRDARDLTRVQADQKSDTEEFETVVG